ncbi:hypothetical protein AMYX_25110 [Anaeromyxobacter diazotrophicus]|uniref:Carrier domain-containing protein n=1 Tax=Anaeromyxobacter diazotrophicus TaxID=2590199 RepID=A0A7I9VNU6_9BACT|nr:hypothetical protein AMYX_25110 [Anaeromyxobacter diazotrophicus]
MLERVAALSVEKRAQLEALLRQRGAALPRPAIPRRAPGVVELPLSYAQQRLWFVEQLEPGSAQYHLPTAVRLRGRLDAVALEQALDAIVCRHEALRATFHQAGGAPVQRIAPEAAVPLPVEDLAPLPQAERETRLAARLAEEARRPFDLAAGPLLRAFLFRLGEREHVVLLTMHHIASDGWSAGVLVREATALYRAFAAGRPSPLAPLPIQYPDFALWQRGWLSGGALRDPLAWWQRQLAGAPAALDLPTDGPRGTGAGQGGSRLFALPAPLAGAVAKLAKERGATPFMALLAAFGAVLQRWTGEEDLCVGTPIANRTQAEVEALIGFFVNTLVLRADLSGEPDARALIGRMREVALGAYAHQDVPFEMVVEVARPERSLARTPLFQVMLVLQNAPPVAFEVGELTWIPEPVETGAASFDLTLALKEGPGGIEGAVEYDAGLFDAATVDRFCGHFRRVLEGMVAHPERPVSALPLLGEEERSRVAGFAAGAAIEDPAPLLPGAVAARAGERPDATALLLGEQRWSYRALRLRAGELARALVAAGVRPGAAVAHLLPRSLDAVAALLAIWEAGAVYVPLDPQSPAPRLAALRADAGAAAVMTTRELRARAGDLGAPAVLVDEVGPREGEEAPPVPVAADALAYLIYTSGSTGTPKGVAVTHRSLAQHCRTIRRHYGIGPDDCVLQFAAFSFDASLEQLLPALSAGATVALRGEGLPEPRRFAEELARAGVTFMDLPPACLDAFVRAWETSTDRERWPRCERLRTVMVSADVVRPDTLAAWRRSPWGEVRLVNNYGPTEATIGCTDFEVPREVAGLVARGRVPIGRPLPGRRAYVVDARGELAPIGLPGELWIGGEGIAVGYLHGPALTAERFLPDPFAAGVAGARVYRTGDRVRWLPDGQLDFLGRLDDQVKLRGFRIELGEIEAALRAHPGVKAAAAALKGEGGERRLVGYVVPLEGGPPGADALAAHLAARLPAYMVPGAFVVLPELPLTTAGKVNRRALPEPAASEPAGEAHLPPRTPVEQVLAGLWTEVLGEKRVGRADDFFALGGHSLLAMQVVARVRDAFGVELPVRALFEAPSLGALARRIEEARGAGRLAAATPPIAPVPRDGPLPLSFAQQRLWFLDQLEPGSPRYNVPAALRVRGPLDVAALRASLDALVMRHEVLRTTYPTVDGKAVQVIAPEARAAFEVEDLSAVAEEAREERARAVAAEEARRPFQLAAGPLLRARVLRLGSEDHVVLLTLHHIVSDGWSSAILVREIARLYQALAAGRPSPLPPLAIQYADFAAWQRAALGDEALAGELAWWTQRLAGAPPSLELPTDRPRAPEQRRPAGAHVCSIPRPTTDALAALARREGATLFMVLLAAFEALLHRLTGEEDFCIGTPVANRGRAELEPLVGFFVNTLVLRADLSGDPSFRELVRRARDAALAAYAHQDVPFEKVVDAVQPERSAGSTPLFQVMFALQNAPTAELEVAGLRWSAMHQETGVALFDLTLNVEEGPEGLAAALEYDRDLFDAATVARMADQLRTLLAGFLADPDRPAAAVPLASSEERRWLLELAAGTAPGPVGPTVPALFEAQAAAGADRPALIAAGAAVGYGALERRASRIARALRAAGVAPGQAVAVLHPRTPDAVASLLAIWKVGGVYLPLDADHPDERLAAVLADADARAAIAPRPLAPRLARAGVALVAPEELPDDGGPPVVAPDAPDAPAYLITTSGSTGKPKCVVVAHRALAEHCRTIRQHYQVGPDDRVLQFASFSFDASLEQLLPALCAGAAVVLRGDGLPDPARFADEIARAGVTFMDLPPAWLDGLLRAWEASPDRERWPRCDRLRTLMVSADAVRPETLALCRRSPWGTARLVNNYGPTEATISCTDYAIPADLSGLAARGRVPIGRPLPGRRAYVLDARREPVPVGVPGELYVGGEGLADGYLGRPDLTAERFLPDPFAPAPGARMYRTGDRVRWLPDGELEFLGRADEQVKLRGFRIELGEIEAALRAHPAVRAAAAAVKEDGATRRLVGYVVPADGVAPAPQALAEHLAALLPPYMIPSAFVSVAALPLTAGGKVSRKALPPPPAEDAAAGFVAPRTSVEEKLAAIWVEVLGATRVGVHDDFFALGGDSILSIQIVARARAAGLELSPRQIFEAPTVAGLALLAGAAREGAAEQGEVVGPAPLTPVQAWCLEQAQPAPHHENQSVLLEVPGPVDRCALAGALRALSRHHDALRLRFERTPEGWRQVFAPVAAAEVPLAFVDLSGAPPAARRAELERLGAAEQAGLDLARGPLFRAAWFDLGPDRPGRLLLVAHHLAVDAVSWRILLEDLAAAYQALAAGRAPALPQKTTSYRAWAEALGRLALAPEVEAELGYWRAEPPEGPFRLPRDLEGGANAEGSAATIAFELGEAETHALLHDLPAGHRGELSDALLTAVAQALARWTGRSSVRLLLEGHGREETEEGIDPSRTVGWFTALYPVWLDLADAAGPGEALRAVREQLRRVPRHGLGHGLLKYLGPAAARSALAAAPDEVCVNYLGRQLDRGAAAGSFAVAGEERGPERSPANQRPHLLEIDAAVAGARLGVRFTYGPEVHRPETIRALAEWCGEALRELAALARLQEAPAPTPSDFALAGIDERTLARLLSQGAVRRGTR